MSLQAFHPGNKSVLIIVGYRPPNSSKLHFMNELHRLLSNLPQDFIIVLGGDFNLTINDSSVTKLCQQFHLTSLIQETTHKQGGTLDKIYV